MLAEGTFAIELRRRSPPRAESEPLDRGLERSDLARRTLPAAHGHLELHLERREEKDRRAVHVRDHVIAIARPRVVEAALERGPSPAGHRPLDRREEASLTEMMLG